MGWGSGGGHWPLPSFLPPVPAPDRDCHLPGQPPPPAVLSHLGFVPLAAFAGLRPRIGMGASESLHLISSRITAVMNDLAQTVTCAALLGVRFPKEHFWAKVHAQLRWRQPWHSPVQGRGVGCDFLSPSQPVVDISIFSLQSSSSSLAFWCHYGTFHHSSSAWLCLASG